MSTREIIAIALARLESGELIVDIEGSLLEAYGGPAAYVASVVGSALKRDFAATVRELRDGIGETTQETLPGFALPAYVIVSDPDGAGARLIRGGAATLDEAEVDNRRQNRGLSARVRINGVHFDNIQTLKAAVDGDGSITIDVAVEVLRSIRSGDAPLGAITSAIDTDGLMYGGSGTFAALVLRDGSTCHICGGAATPDDPFQEDHIRSRSEGGTDDIGNLAIAHASCNRAKSVSSFPIES